MTLRSRISVAAAAGVMLVVAVVSTALYFSYADSLHSRDDADLVAAAQQAITVAQNLKQSAGKDHTRPAMSQPVSVGGIQLQLRSSPKMVWGIWAGHLPCLGGSRAVRST
jgi:two-component system, OmpR family, sensor histidine kinase MprB